MIQFTKEVKENWLANLRSGKYKQGFCNLHNPADNSFCCIGVLGDCTDDLDNSKEEEVGCHPYAFLKDNINKSVASHIWEMNDDSQYRDNPDYPCDYSNVIPLIESLPTVD